ncbi:hypothetical protein NPX13_g629 [Xylaria arbuscula]|uniref:Cytochrome c oxidase assembly protein COX15 n=1 Tax=Xylaria arbuscula TaxID=114810 RepID=A0A9W8TRT8_9PEZI|nr:hypothetical protein NPX13_g629 [Xylaria arbuscula]
MPPTSVPASTLTHPPVFAPARRHASTTTSTTTKRPALSPSFFSAQPALGSNAAMSTATQATAQQLSKRAFPEVTSSKSVAYWLLGSAASVFGIVVFGGLTRLTESGLSITEWKPVTGSLPPMNQEDWESEFEKYRASPEFKMLNSHMDLAEFKKIYFMEWTHRLWGRVIGLSFVIPTAYFIARRRVSARMAWNLVGISGLIGFQGFIGWWMVKSGLKDDLFAPGSHPRVSQYRLTTHLATAFVCYSWMLLAGLSILRTRRLLANPAESMKLIEMLKQPAMVPFRRSVAALTALVFTTVLSGALVAGLDAGLIYNAIPQDGSWIGPTIFRTMGQLDHRILATTTFCSILALFAYARRGRVAAVLPKDARKGVMGVVHLVCLQAALGISTLIYMVPIPLAAAHQAGALALLTGTLVLGQRIRIPVIYEYYVAHCDRTAIREPANGTAEFSDYAQVIKRPPRALPSHNYKGSSVTLLTAFNTSLIRSDYPRQALSQCEMKKRLNKFVCEVRAGYKEGSIAQLQREFEDVGINPAIVEENHEYISQWMKNALANGVLDEDAPTEVDNPQDQSIRSDSGYGESPMFSPAALTIANNRFEEEFREKQVNRLIEEVLKPLAAEFVMEPEGRKKPLTDLIRLIRKLRSALSMCAYGGHLAVAKLFLEHGADLNILDVDGDTPMQIATTRGHSELVILFDEVRAERDRLARECDAEVPN